MQEDIYTKNKVSLLTYEKKKRRKSYFLLIQSHFHLKENYKPIYKNERAGILLSAIPFLVFIWVGILSSMQVRLYLQNRTATLYRLEFCSRSIVEHRRSLLKKIQKTNRGMVPLRHSLYMMRGIKFVPGLQVGSAVTEKILLESLRMLSGYQNTIVKLGALKEISLYYCKKNTYSKSMGLCHFSHISKKNFIRTKALFPDIPGSLQIKEKRKVLLETKCFTRNKNKILSRTMFLQGDPNLTKDEFEVFYGKSPRI